MVLWYAQYPNKKICFNMFIIMTEDPDRDDKYFCNDLFETEK